MKKTIIMILLLITVLPAIVLSAETTTTTTVTPTIPNLNPKTNYCTALTNSKLLFRAHQLVWNDDDDGIAGNVWAFDKYERYFWVYQYTNGGTHYCALVQYITNPNSPGFVTIAGRRSPGDTANLIGGIKGRIYGGYIATFDAVFPGAPSFKELGLVNYKCKGAVKDPSDCQGYYDWTTKFFTSVTNFDQPQWGWQYTVVPGKYSCSSTVWFNTYTATTGDIVCA